MLSAMSGDGRPPRRVFLSHTSELRRYPAGRSFVAAVESAVARAGDAVVDMAYFEARALPPTAVCRDTVRAADVYLRWPGSTTARRCATGPSSSYTEIEFEAATEHGLPRLVFLLDEDAEGPRGLLVDREHGDRQERVPVPAAGQWGDDRSVLDAGRVETALYQALAELAGGRAPVGRVWNIPGRAVEFTGRAGMLVDLRAVLRSGGRAAVQAVHGMVGPPLPIVGQRAGCVACRGRRSRTSGARGNSGRAARRSAACWSRANPSHTVRL